jgi:glycine/D-amino acid oxidase-like deaminating enzyme
VNGPLRLAAELDPASVSWWFQDALTRDGAAVEPLTADREADVAVVGGGYTGLWAAIELAERGSADVVLLEAERCGSQASGKNGGVVHGYWTGLAGLVSAFGVDAARTIAEAGSAAQDGLLSFCASRAEDLWRTERGSV